MAQPLDTPLAPTSQALLLTRTFHAPRQLVWQAWTQPDYLMRWWGPKEFTSPVCRVDLRVGGEYHFCMRSPQGQDFWSKGTYLFLDAPHQLVCTDSFSDEAGHLLPASALGMTGDWPLELQITLTLEETNGTTLLTIQHEGLPEGEMKEMCMGGWLESLDKLEQTLQVLLEEKSATTFEKELVTTHTVQAPREQVFGAWTQAEHLQHWWGPKGFQLKIVQLELVPGGTFLYHIGAAQGPAMWGKFVYEQITAPQRLVYLSSFTDAAGHLVRAPFSTTWPLQVRNQLTLSEANGQTTFTLCSQPYQATKEEEQTFMAAADAIRQGLRGTFEQLDTYLAQR